jgi:phosphopantothenoylcysteine decarboxylase/phosphopantothenate--cysteine ligase
MLSKLRNKKVLITAGPTREYIDPVRYISNESSGKTGYAIADILHHLGADVTLISGPVSINSTIPNLNIIFVTTASEMFEQCKQHFHKTDIAIFSAAVADYRTKFISNCKVKTSEQVVTLQFTKNTDIAFEFGQVKSKDQISIGFALETDDVFKNAKNKLSKKRLDAIVINSPKPGQAFGYGTNKISILSKSGELNNYPLKRKTEVAQDIINALAQLLR